MATLERRGDNVKVAVYVFYEINEDRQGVALSLHAPAGRVSAVLTDPEVDDLIVLLEYYKTSRAEN